MKIKKSIARENVYAITIAYAYATSTHANHFGMGKTGCYFIQLDYYREDGSIATGIHPMANSEGFLSKDDPDLISLFNEIEGDL
jgi:hypothetical protein